MDIKRFELGHWQVIPASNTLVLGEHQVVLEPKAMDVLVLLCRKQGEVLSAEEILATFWPSTEVGDNPVHKVIAQLRKALGDKASSPEFIETIRKRGYRVIAEVNFPFDDQQRANKTQWQGDSPFPGLSAFDAADADVFFGRNEQVQALLEQVAIQAQFGRAFSLLLGPSGTGKSSLINAGVLPKLTNESGFAGMGVVSHTSLDFADVSESRMLVDLASCLLDWDVNDKPVFDGWSADLLAERLVNNVDKVLACCRDSLAKCKTSTIRSPRLSLFIDRLEVLLSSPLFSEEQREQVLACIEALANSGAVIVFSACRNDFYPLLVKYPSLMVDKKTGGHFDLLAPTRAELMQMIRLPAVAAGLNWSIDDKTGLSLDELLCNEAASHPDSLPMLQYTLQELYLQRSDKDELSVEVYRALGGIEGAIGKKAEEVYSTMDKHRQDELDYVLSLLVTLSADGETITSRTARWTQLTTDSQKAFAQAMVDSRLFVSHLQQGEPCFSVAHEALLRRWTRATDWINAHRESLSAKSRLRHLTDNWLQESKNNAYLLAEGKPLREAIDLSTHSHISLDSDEKQLVKASLKRTQRKKWLVRATVVLLCVLTLTSGVMSFRSQQAEALAQEKRLEAESLLGFMVGEFADKLRSVKRMDLLDGISNKALEYFSSEEQPSNSAGLFSFLDSSRSFEARYQHAQTLMAMGEVAYSRGKPEEAKLAFESSSDLLKPLLEEQPENLTLLTTIGANAFWLGQLAYDANDLDSALPFFQRYKTYSQEMNRIEPDNMDAWYELSSAENTLGSLYLKQQNYSAAQQAFQSSLVLTDKSLKQTPDDNWLRVDKADTLSWLASTALHLGELQSALILHQQSQAEIELVVENEPGNANFIESLAYSYWNQAKILKHLNELESAHAKLLEAENLLINALEQDPENNVWQGDKLSVKVSLLLVDAKLGIYAKNAQVSIDAVKGFERLYLQTEFARYLQLTGDWELAEEMIRYTQSYVESVSEASAKQADFIAALSQLDLIKAKQAEQANLELEKTSACKHATQRLKPLVLSSRNVAYLLPYAQAHACLNRMTLIPDEVQILNQMGIESATF